MARKKEHSQTIVPSTWIRIADPSAACPNPLYHAVIAESKSRVVTACERIVEPGDIKDSKKEARYRCGSCWSRLNSVPYLLPNEQRLAELLRS